jgi:hypothetical protein
MTRVLIHLHLFNLELLNEFIKRINDFIKNNKHQNIHLMISIPISYNIDKFITLNNSKIASQIQENAELRRIIPIIHYMMDQSSNQYDSFFMKIKRKILEHSAWLNPNLITKKNCSYLLSLIQYIIKHLFLRRNCIHYTFIENRGQDIGGFLTMLKFLKDSGEQFDYYIKMHTKTHTGWRREMTKILNIPVDQYAGKYDCVYAKKYNYPYQMTVGESCFQGLMKLFKYFELPPKSFHYPAGTFFIVNHRYIQIFLNKNIDYLFSWMNPMKPPHGTIEYCYERFFGYLIDFFKMRKLLIS